MSNFEEALTDEVVAITGSRHMGGEVAEVVLAMDEMRMIRSALRQYSGLSVVGLTFAKCTLMRAGLTDTIIDWVLGE